MLRRRRPAPGAKDRMTKSCRSLARRQFSCVRGKQSHFPCFSLPTGRSLPPLPARLHKSVAFHSVERMCSCGRVRQNRKTILPASPTNRREQPGEREAENRLHRSGARAQSSRISKRSRRQPAPLRAWMRIRPYLLQFSNTITVPLAAGGQSTFDVSRGAAPNWAGLRPPTLFRLSATLMPSNRIFIAFVLQPLTCASYKVV